MSVEYTDPPFPSCPTCYVHIKQKDLSLKRDCNLFLKRLHMLYSAHQISSLKMEQKGEAYSESE